MAKIHTFFTFDNNIYQTETLESLKLGYPVRKAFCQSSLATKSSFVQYFLYQQIGDFKMTFLAQLSSSVVSKK